MSLEPVKYRFSMFCETENKTVLGVYSAASEPTPTQCPHDPAHTITATSVKLLSKTYADEFRLASKETGFNNSHFWAQNVLLNIADHQNPQHTDVTFPIPVCIFKIQFNIKSYSLGDKIDLVMAPNTNIGLISGAVSVGDNKITLAASQLKFLDEGYSLQLSDGVNTQDMGKIIAKDWTTNQVTMEEKSDYNFALGGSFALLSVVFASLTFNQVGEYVLGNETNLASVLPADVVMRLTYCNLSGGAKRSNVMFQLSF